MTTTKPRLTENHVAQARILKALAHPVRLLFVEALAEKPHCVCELQQLVGLDMSTVSKHLSVLKNAGIVKDSKRGTQVIYHLMTPCVLNLLTCVEETIRQNLKRQLEVLR
jgi:ArsR family transcriptional regulator